MKKQNILMVASNGMKLALTALLSISSLTQAADPQALAKNVSLELQKAIRDVGVKWKLSNWPKQQSVKIQFAQAAQAALKGDLSVYFTIYKDIKGLDGEGWYPDFQVLDPAFPYKSVSEILEAIHEQKY